MATSESDIRKAVSLLLTQYGSLTTSEVKTLLHTVIPFDDEDKIQSGTRNEMLITQRIGNIVSHQSETQKIYFDTYLIDKSTKPATWSILTGLKTAGQLQPISATQASQRKALRRRFRPKKIDWQSVSEQRTTLGYLGESFVIRYETGRILGFAPQDVERIIHLSHEQGDGAGFDVLSLNEDGSERYIEVKTTQQGKNTPFYMTENERAFFEIHQNAEDLFIYRVFNFDTVSHTGEIDIISAKDLFTHYQFDPISYQVTKK